MSEHPQFNLRIIRVDEHMSFLGNKSLAYQTSLLQTYRNVLEIGIRAAQSTCAGDGLVEGCMDLASLPT